jgi:hypothetical protein
VVNALQGLGWTSLRDLSDITVQDRSNLHGRLQKLVEDGAVERKEQKGRVYYKVVEGAPARISTFPPAATRTRMRRKDCSSMPTNCLAACRTYHVTTLSTTTSVLSIRCAEIACCRNGSVVAKPTAARHAR